MVSTSVCRVARRGIVLRRLHPVPAKLSTHLFAITRATSLRSLPANSSAIRHFSASACVFVTKKATKPGAAKSKKTATSKKPVKKVVKKGTKRVAKQTTRRAAAKKKTTARRKVAKKKATPRKATPKKKPLTEEQKLRLEKRREKEKLKQQKVQKREEKQQLHETGLIGKEPKALPASGWMVFVMEKVKADPKAKLSENLKEWGANFKALPPAEQERYKATASQNIETNKATYEAWVKSHRAKDTYLANQARRKLSRILNKKLKLIHDARIPKRPSGPFMEFIKAHPQEDGGNLLDLSKMAGREWNSMDAPQKQPYVDLWAKDKERYRSEMKAIGIDIDV